MTGKTFTWLASAILLSIGVAACGGGETSTAAADPDSVAGTETAQSPEDVAEQNLPNLQSADDARDIEMLAVSDGSVATLREAVDGGLDVQVWYLHAYATGNVDLIAVTGR